MEFESKVLRGPMKRMPQNAVPATKRWWRTCYPTMKACATGCALVSLLACNKSPSPDSSRPAATTPAVPGVAIASATLPTLPAKPSVDDKTLRRAYGPAELKLAKCASLEKDGTVLGKQCLSNYVVYGPYVNAPANSTLRISFDIQSDSPVLVKSDVSSEAGKRFHGEFDEHQIQAGEKHTLSYGIHLFEPATAVEARIGLRAENPVDVRITNLAVQVL